MAEPKKIEVRFVRNLYPYSKGDIGFIREDFARGQFKEFVEILDDASEKSVSSPESDKSMRKRSKKNK